jgi:hypothetical protein
MKGLRTITANEARAYLEGNWRTKLNEIYDGVRANLEVGASPNNFQKFYQSMLFAPNNFPEFSENPQLLKFSRNLCHKKIEKM